jgi:RNA polymerase sigma-70 factor, ECF subfamily
MRVPAPASAPTDRDLIAAARAGDAQAIDRLVTRYEPQVYRFSRRLCGDADAAADVAQETLMAMVRALPRFRGDAALSTWLYTIARRRCQRRHRRSRFAPEREESLDRLDTGGPDALPSDSPTPEQVLSTRELEAAVTRALSALPAAHREVLVLRDMEGLTAPEAGEVLGLGVRAVKSRLHRARVALRRQLAPVIGGRGAEDVKPGCRDVATLFSRYLEGELGRKTCAEMEAHLAGCTGCRATCESLKRVLAVCRHASGPALPRALRRSIRAAIAGATSRRRGA